VCVCGVFVSECVVCVLCVCVECVVCVCGVCVCECVCGVCSVRVSVYDVFLFLLCV